MNFPCMKLFLAVVSASLTFARRAVANESPVKLQPAAIINRYEVEPGK